MDPTSTLQIPVAPSAWLSSMLEHSYVGRTFSLRPATVLLWRDVLCFPLAALDDALFLSTPFTFSTAGIPLSYSVALADFPYLRANACSADGTLRVVLDYTLPSAVRIVPQRRWSPYAGQSREAASLQAASLGPPIFFVRPDGAVGLHLLAAKTATKTALLSPDWEPMPERSSIKLRICWQGYEKWVDQMQLRKKRHGDSAPFTLLDIMRHVAKRVEKFMTEAPAPAPVDVCDSDAAWVIGEEPHEIRPANVILVGIVAVSPGSVMPILQLA